VGTLFGHRVEPDFDIAKEKRRDRLKLVGIAGFIVCGVYLFSGRPYADQGFQGFFATTLFYGDNFYVRRGNDLGRLWLWKGIFATIPFHVLYLAAIFWSDRAFPEVMTKAIVFIPLLAVGFAVESIRMQKLIDHFRPPSVDQASGSVTPTS
jgi:hypothetical protein